MAKKNKPDEPTTNTVVSAVATGGMPVSGVHKLDVEPQPNFKMSVTYFAGATTATLITTTKKQGVFGNKQGWYLLKFKDGREISVNEMYGMVRYNGSYDFGGTPSATYQQASPTELYVRLNFTPTTGDQIYIMLYNKIANATWYGSDLITG